MYSFTTLVESTDDIPGTEAWVAQKILALEIARSKIILLWDPWGKEAQICQQMDMMGGAVMALLASWKG